MRISLSFLLILFSGITFAQLKSEPNSKPFVLGQIEEIISKELSEKRILNIYLPEGYNEDKMSTYPVIYLLDGSADEDFIHVAGLIQFNNFSWVNRVPKSIVVGIANIDRKRDFTYPTSNEKEAKKFPTTGKSEKFIAFIEKELQPYIQQNFRTNDSKMIIGQSFGGLLATEILLKKPKLFNKYVIISPSLWWDNASLLNINSEIFNESFVNQTDVYIGVGKEGLTPSEIPRVMEVDANLLTEKLKSSKSKNIRALFDYLPEENHATITHQAVFNALRLLFPIKE
jgi:predicted alpha/beta superfamily hydrolase